MNRANSILIEYANTAKLYNHGFFDEAILALKLDGVSDFFVLVNQNRVPDLNVIKYLKNKYLAVTEQSNTQPSKGTGQAYDTDKGEIVVHFGNPWQGMPYRGDSVFINSKPAPDGKYKIGIMAYIYVEAGRIYKTTMF